MKSALWIILIITAGLGLACLSCGSGKEPADCSAYSDECSDERGAGYFCDADELWVCELACHPECGCFGSLRLVDTCDLGCDDTEQGFAQCAKQ